MIRLVPSALPRNCSTLSENRDECGPGEASETQTRTRLLPRASKEDARGRRLAMSRVRRATELEVHPIRFRSALGDDDLNNLSTLCSPCHKTVHLCAKR